MTPLVSPAKWRLRNERSNTILMKYHNPDLGSASDWSRRLGNLLKPIRGPDLGSKGHQYGTSEVVPQTSFGGETSDGATKMSAVSQASLTTRSESFVVLFLYTHSIPPCPGRQKIERLPQLLSFVPKWTLRKSCIQKLSQTHILVWRSQ